MTRRVLKPVLQYAIGLSLLAFVIYRNWRPASGEPGLAETLRLPFHGGIFALAFVTTMTSAFISITRWYFLVIAQGLPFRYPDALRLGMAGFFFNTFLPGSVGGDIVKAAGIAREQTGRRTAAVATVLIDRLIGLWGLVGLLAACGLAFWWLGNPLLVENVRLMRIVEIAWIVMAGTIVGWIVAGFLPETWAEGLAGRLRQVPKVGGSLAELWRAFWTYRRKPASVALALGLTILNHLVNVTTFHLASRVFVDEAEASILPGLVEHYLVVPVGMTVQAFFPTPGGLGGGEYSYGALYSILGKPAALGVRASLIARSLAWVLGIIGYIVYLTMKKPGVHQPSEPTHSGSDQVSSSGG